MFLTPLFPYLLIFCRAALILVFAISFARKVVNIAQFQSTISNFHLLPSQMSKGAALAFLGGEGSVILCLVFGSAFLVSGFTLASLLLLIFSGALVTVLVRKIATSCNCFGSSEKQVSLTDIWRNILFLFCALGGLALLMQIGGAQTSIDFVAYLESAICATIFVVFLLQLHEIVRIFQ